MTCNFFTIVKSYFVCCNTTKKDNEDKDNNRINYYLDSSTNGLYSFDDLTYENINSFTNKNTPHNTSMSSNESSSSSLEDYHLSEKQQRQLKESLQRIKRYNQQLLHQRHYAEVYETSAW